MEQLARRLPDDPFWASAALAAWAALAATALGLLIADAVIVAAALLAVLALPFAATIRPVYWIAGALAAGILLRGLATADILPGAASFLHYPMVAAGLAVALAGKDPDWARAKLPLAAIVAIAGLAVVSALVAGLELVRAAFMSALLLEPMAVVATLALARPTREDERLVARTLITLILVQIPISLAQLAGVSFVTVEDRVLQDRVEGTLAGSDAAAHHLGGIGAIVGIWGFFVLRGWRRWGMALLSIGIPAITAAKQVLVAIPPAAAAALLTGGSPRWRQIGLVVALVAFVISLPVLLSGYAGRQLDAFFAGTGGKAQSIERVTDDAGTDYLTGMIGSGPATSVSASAWLTTDELREGDSPLSPLGLEPAQKAIDLGALQGIGGAIDSPRSSAIGLGGDLGLLGLLAYLGAWAAIGTAIFRRGGPHAPGAIAALVVAAPLGVISDFWEIPPFPLFAGAIIALGYAAPLRGEDDQ